MMTPTRSDVLPLGSWEEVMGRRLDERQVSSQFRSRRIVRPIDATHIEFDGGFGRRRYVNFASNNYLGLTHHPRLLEGARRQTCGAGSGAAGLISGYTDAHAAAEKRLAQWKGTEAAILLPSGYQANHAAVQTFAAISPDSRNDSDAGVRFVIDKLAHASLIDAVRATRMPMRVFPHNHLDKLGRLLADAPSGQLQVVITESIFSMDGDAADLAGLARLKADFNFALLLDEAHGAGVYGPAGSGYAAELGLAGLADVTICTLSKAAGVVGGAICASRMFCDAVINFGRAYIYSTSVPPAIAGLAEIAINVMRDEPQRQERVRKLAKTVRSRLRELKLNVPTGDSPIVPVILGEEKTTLDAAEALLAAGIYCVAVRPPTVAKGTSRLRVTLSSEHTDDEIDRLISACAAAGRSKL